MNKGVSISVKNGRRVVEGLGYYEPRKAGDLRELVKGSANRYGDALGFKYKDKEGKITGKTYKEFDREIDCLGTALIKMGLKGTRISVIGENRYEWGVCYYSVVNGTGVVVPLDKNLPKLEIENLLERGRVEAVFYSPAFHDVMKEIAAAGNKIRYFICMEAIGGTLGENDRFTNLPALIAQGGKLLDEGDRSFIDAEIDRQAMSILLFTSGTTSMSKGVMLSHANVVSNVAGITTVIKAGPGDVHLSLLPLHHTFENTIGLMFMVHSGVCIAFPEGIKYIAQNIKEYNVSLLVAVPAILELMYRRMLEGIEKSGKAGVVKALTVVSEMLRKVGIDLRRKLLKSIFEKLGPNLRLVVSGAAPLDPEVVKGFDKIGLRLLQGYGLTETSPVVATNNDFVNKPGTIGYPMAGIEVAIDSPDENGMGEIITRGENVMLGYYEDPQATKEAIDSEGWFRTGDLGSIDEEGFIRITGRAKSMIVFTNGKKAFPEEFEVLLNNIPGVKESFVWGNKAHDGDIQVCAELVIDREKLEAQEAKLPSEKELADRFQKAIREINKSLPQYKVIRYFVMTYENLAKTTKMTVRRPVELEKVMARLEKAGLEMRKANGRIIDSLSS
ncbi:MAG: AMP-binding protein [Clostridia bacterium]|nr:AMP-binding protein [Clostridia bacterium]